MTDAAHVGRWLAERLPAMEALLAELVEQNSFTENAEGGRAVARVLGEALRIEGLAEERVPSARFADHLVFRSVGAAGVPPIALVGHLDTVFPPGTFEGYRRDGVLRRGPGVLDMKGGLVVVAFALRALAETVGLDRVAPVRLVVVSDEEVGSPEGQEVIRRAALDAKGALVFEAGRKGDLVITRRKGTGAMTVVAHGKAAHAGNAHAEGASAIRALARFVEAAERQTDYARGVTVNVGTFVGGTSKNTVPERAEAKLDLRFETIADGERLVAALRAAAEEAARAVPGTRLEVEGGIARQPLERTVESARLLDAYGEAARAVGLGAGEAPLIGGGSDASTTSAVGIASIDGLGPRGTGFHTKDELIEVETLVPKAQALARFLLAWTERGGR
jgi:glutamate carboxypeptidase